MSTIWVTRWFCPKEHLAFGLGWAAESHTAEEIVAFGEASGMNMRCGICGGGIAPRHERTAYQTMDEAQVALTRESTRQMELRMLMDLAGLTREPIFHAGGPD